MATQYDGENLLAVQGVRQALALHSQGVDRADEGLLAAAYHDDGEVDYGFFKGAASEFVPILSSAQRQGPVTLHRSSPPWVQILGERALSETYVLACAEGEEDGQGVQRLIGGRYLDRLSRRRGEWRLDHRRYVMDWNINRPGQSAWPGTSALLANFVPRGGHAEADPGRTLLALGLARIKTQEKTMSADNRDAQLDEALAKLAVHDLLMAYARGVDRADSELLGSIFLPDSTVVSGAFNGSGPEFAREITRSVSENLVRCFHSIANEWVKVEGEHAVGEAYVIAHMTAGGTDTVTGGRYVNEFERRDGSWKIRSHTFVADWNMNLPTSFQSDGMYAALDSRGCFGRNDPVYRFWESA
ncbi:nuclear transport factor 2 family protein [Parahaliea aestuarii]|uniref:Nuclear transport factor 2 family protein n=1 Tax=Parahaliea aestuarii TaxID=1852021 RepID=A0A5C9A693_9GAMM|nr:nuclear transport factor 2 family protein [Parahaliea aestuarii]TXS95077.1 nuclear transport factor 2 family protein [Parahaliea aestuarii]